MHTSRTQDRLLENGAALENTEASTQEDWHREETLLSKQMQDNIKSRVRIPALDASFHKTPFRQKASKVEGKVYQLCWLPLLLLC